jgi:phage shock protein A
LDQQIRDAAAAVERGKRALAVAIAHDESEAKRLEATSARIADLEERAVAALAGGREDLASEAAESIAVMEVDRDAVRDGRAAFAREIAHLKKTTTDAGRRLADLERGRRIAQAAEAVRRLKSRGPAEVGGAAALSDAEATLRRLRERQAPRTPQSTHRWNRSMQVPRRIPSRRASKRRASENAPARRPPMCSTACENAQPQVPRPLPDDANARNRRLP